MNSLLLLSLLSQAALTEAALVDFGHLNLLLMQDRITLRRGEGGGVSIQPDPGRVNRSYQHSTRPLFGPDVGRAAQQSSSRLSRRYTPPPPLITSRDVARWEVRRSVIGPRWRW